MRRGRAGRICAISACPARASRTPPCRDGAADAVWQGADGHRGRCDPGAAGGARRRSPRPPQPRRPCGGEEADDPARPARKALVPIVRAASDPGRPDHRMRGGRVPRESGDPGAGCARTVQRNPASGRVLPGAGLERVGEAGPEIAPSAGPGCAAAVSSNRKGASEGRASLPPTRPCPRIDGRSPAARRGAPAGRIAPASGTRAAREGSLARACAGRDMLAALRGGVAGPMAAGRSRPCPSAMPAAFRQRPRARPPERLPPQRPSRHVRHAGRPASASRKARSRPVFRRRRQSPSRHPAAWGRSGFATRARGC